MFAVVAMFVAIAVVAAGLVATSTFRIVVAQRMRQLALLRAVRAGRGSISRALAAEGALTGFVAGLLANAAEPGEDGRNAGQKAMQQLTRGRTGLDVQVLADQRDQANLVLNGVLAVAIGLVGLTVLIAVVGVGTTTALSVVERVRESGLLRAVGLSRGGLRAMLTAESSLYGVIGATIGLALGVPYAWLSIKALGVNAPLALPARRTSQVSPVAALATDG